MNKMMEAKKGTRFTCNTSCHETGDAACNQRSEATAGDVSPSLWSHGRCEAKREQL